MYALCWQYLNLGGEYVKLNSEHLHEWYAVKFQSNGGK